MLKIWIQIYHRHSIIFLCLDGQTVHNIIVVFYCLGNLNCCICKLFRQKILYFFFYLLYKILIFHYFLSPLFVSFFDFPNTSDIFSWYILYRFTMLFLLLVFISFSNRCILISSLFRFLSK